MKKSLNISSRDQQVIWHPFTQHKTSLPPTSIVKGNGAYLFDEKGNKLLDLISSWWVNLHGHAEPTIAKAIYDQALQLEHVIFSNFTHEPAVQLAENLIELLPGSISKIFYSDNGSTAVEIALKMAYQYWRNLGNHQKKRFLAFDHGYHGDTFGAMSVGRESGFFSSFDDLLFSVDTFPYPETWAYDEMIQMKEQKILSQIDDYLKINGPEVAAMIIEPLVQGVAGMKMCRSTFLQQLELLMHSHQILVIYDEVMTGFGRTGADFASIKAKTSPDIICIAKGLTGGFLPLSVTACTEKIYQAFLGNNFNQALAHGHSYTANPLGCAAGLASLALLKNDKTQKQIKVIEAIHHRLLNELSEHLLIGRHRYCGTIAAFDLKIPLAYGDSISVNLRQFFQQQGLLVRPLGNTIYFMPPYCITELELENAYQIVIDVIKRVKA